MKKEWRRIAFALRCANQWPGMSAMYDRAVRDKMTEGRKEGSAVDDADVSLSTQSSFLAFT